MSLHRAKGQGRVRVRLRASLGGQAIDGYLPSSKMEDVRNAWGSRVILVGTVRRNKADQIVRIEADDLVRLPAADLARPRLEELYGAAPDLLDGLTVDQYLGQVRHA